MHRFQWLLAAALAVFCGAGSDISGACGGNIDVTVDNGPLEHFALGCMGDIEKKYPGAIGYHYSGRAANAPAGIKIVGCRTSPQPAESIALYVTNANGVGTYRSGTPKYSDAKGNLFGRGDDPFSLELTTYGPVGAYIDGTFKVTSSKNTVSHQLSGRFHVCRAPDYVGP